MPFVSLKSVRDQVWTVAMLWRMATDMTGVSWPVLEFDPSSAQSCSVSFLLYYVVREDTDLEAFPQMTRPYALLRFDPASGELVSIQKLSSDGATALTEIGPSANAEARSLPNVDYRAACDLLFHLYDDMAQLYAAGTVSLEQTKLMADWLSLFTRLAEPPLLTDYAWLGERFFAWVSAKLENHNNQITQPH